MSILVSSQIDRGDLGRMTTYLERAKPGQVFARVEHCINDLGDSPESFNQQARRLLDPTSRKVDGQSLVISFTETEFPTAGEHGQDVAELAYELARRGAPDAPLLVVSQRDGVGKHWHAHVLVLNHDMQTGKASRGHWHHSQWRDENDNFNRENGLEVCGQEAQVPRVARLAAARGIELQADADLVALSPSAVPRTDAEQFIGSHVIEAVLDGRLDAVPEPGDSLVVPLPTHPGYGLSVRAKGTGLSYAITDAAGEPVLGAAGGRGGKPRLLASTGTKLDKALAKGQADHTFNREGLLALLASLEEEMELEDDGITPREAGAPEGREASTAQPETRAPAPTPDSAETRAGGSRARLAAAIAANVRRAARGAGGGGGAAEGNGSRDPRDVGRTPGEDRRRLRGGRSEIPGAPPAPVSPKPKPKDYGDYGG